ncbi:MAG: hypothetical protein V1799_07830 [bacterium]
MKVFETLDLAWIKTAYESLNKSRALVDRIEYKLAGLSPAFTEVFALVVSIGSRPHGILPLCRIKDRVEVLGQYWGEGYRLPVSEESFLRMHEWLENNKLMLEYSLDALPGMSEMEDRQAFLPLPSRSTLSWYVGLFQESKKDKQIIDEALKYEKTIGYNVKGVFTLEDISLLKRLAFGRLGAESRFENEDFLASFVGVLGYLKRISALRVVTFYGKDKKVGIMFLLDDMIERRVTFLSGFYEPELNGFGKHMYYRLVDVAGRLNAAEIVAMMPVNRIKRVMMYQGRLLYEMRRNIN